MELSVVVPTLNGRESLERCLDALAEHVPDAEHIVVNGPSADGTTGMVRDRDDVDVLLELADRNLGAARNAGIAAATGDAIALVDDRTAVEAGWGEAVVNALEDGADVVTGPIHRPMAVGTETTTPETSRIADRVVTHVDGGNVAFTRRAIERLDGFDESLAVGGARDVAHRIAAMGLCTEWVGDATVTRTDPVRADGDGERDWRLIYRSLAYRLAKNYGPVTTARRTLHRAVVDGIDALRDVVAGHRPVSRWAGEGRDVALGGLHGAAAGLVARYRDRRPGRNPDGLSARADRAVRRYDWR